MNSSQCPIDRRPFNVATDLKFDSSIQRKNFEYDQESFKKIAKEIVDFRIENRNSAEFSLCFGNTHTIYESATNANRHNWSAFVSLKNIDIEITRRMEQLKNDSDLPFYLNMENEYNKVMSGSDGFVFDASAINMENVIKQVKFMLHPSFTPKDITIPTAPFKITRLGWAEFNVTMEVEFKDGLNMENMELDHYISFSKDLTESKKKIYLNVEKVLGF